MSESLYIGLDGGGTGCRARLSDAAGRVLGEAKGGPANINLEGGRVARASLLACATDALTQAGLGEGDLGRVYAGMGLAGSEVGDALPKFLALGFPFAGMEVVGDGETACLGAHQGEDGGIVNLGTGSVGVAVVNGVAQRVSGLGFWAGDQGSGADIGRAALRLVGKARDGDTDSGSLHARLMERFGDIYALAGWAKVATPAEYGGLAPMVFEAAEAGERPAMAIIADAASELERLIRLVQGMGASRIAVFGSVARRLVPWIAPPYRAPLVEPRGDGLDGALVVARRLG